jgi:hypothetical protein
MTETYHFFNSTANDKRLMSAEDFANVFSTVISDGLIHRDGQPKLKVKSGQGLRTLVETGIAFIKGHPFNLNEEKEMLHDSSDEIFDRIDRIILRFDNRIEARYIKLFVLKGVPSSSPKVPGLTRTSDVYELSLAQIRIKANCVSIANVDIIDERMNKDVCGLADSLMTIPLEDMKNDFNEFKSQLVNQYNEAIGNLGGSSDPVKFQKDLKLTKLNQLELLIERDIENKSTTMDKGLFFDSFKNEDKIDKEKTTAIVDNENKQVRLNGQSISNDIYWNPHTIRFVTNNVTHIHTRPVNTLVKVTSDSLAGQDRVKIAKVKLTVTEVNK